MATLEQATSILNKLALELQFRQSSIVEYENGYRGTHSLTFASDDFRDYFGKQYSKFTDNWCGIVADAPHERLEITGIRLPEQEAGDNLLWDAWRRNDADVFSDLAFLDAIVAKRAFAMVWANDDGDPLITWEHPSQAIVTYDPETRARVAGAKVWADDELEYATLYLPDEIWKFQRSRVRPVVDPDHPLPLTMMGGWDLRAEGVIDNPMGKVPLVEFPNRPRLLGGPTSDIAGVLPMQHAINLLWAQLFVSTDEATLGQRVIIGAEMPKIPILNDAGEQIGERPIDLKKFARDRALWLEDPNTKIAQWQPAKLDVFTNVVEIAVGHIAAQTRTPAHYLLIGGTIANVSGDAMKALETGLVKRTEEKTQHFGRAARDVFELVALVQGDQAKASAVRTGTVLWKDIENISDAQRADALQKKSAIGYPLSYLLEQDGLSPTEVARVMQMKRDEALDPFDLLDPVTRAAMKGAAGGDTSATAGA
jgi:hypothetical protein